MIDTNLIIEKIGHCDPNNAAPLITTIKCSADILNRTLENLLQKGVAANQITKLPNGELQGIPIDLMNSAMLMIVYLASTGIDVNTLMEETMKKIAVIKK